MGVCTTTNQTLDIFHILNCPLRGQISLKVQKLIKFLKIMPFKKILNPFLENCEAYPKYVCICDVLYVYIYVSINVYIF